MNDTGTVGFSLLEAVVAVAVLAVLAVGSGLASGRSAAGNQNDADRFQRAYAQQWSLAVTGRETRGLSVSQEGLAHWRYSTAGWVEQGRLYEWRGRASLSGPVVLPGQPQIVLSPDGRATPFTLVFSQGRGTAWTCRGDGWSSAQCETN